MSRSLDGWYGIKFSRSDLYPKAGLPPGQPVLVARRKMRAPWPDVEHVLAITPSALVAHQRGDGSVLLALAADLEASHERFCHDCGAKAD